MTESLLDGKWLGYAHTHSFVKWYDLSGKDPIVVDTEDKMQTGPLRRRTNFLYGRAGCCVFRGGMLVVNDGSFILLAAGQDRNADGSPWKAFTYANSATVRPRGAPAWNGADRVMLASADLREISLVDFGETDCPKLLWQEKTAGFPGCPLFHQGRFLVPCGYQGLLRERSKSSGDLISATDK